MAKKKKEDSPYTTWIIVGVVILMMVLAFIKNYSWLKKQDSKPFGYEPMQIPVSSDRVTKSDQK